MYRPRLPSTSTALHVHDDQMLQRNLYDKRACHLLEVDGKFVRTGAEANTRVTS
jgi:hypothetical protein